MENYTSTSITAPRRRSPVSRLSPPASRLRLPPPASRLRPRPALNIKDRAALTPCADQPVALTRVAKPERATSNLTARHRHRAARTQGHLPGGEFDANLLQLARSVLG